MEKKTLIFHLYCGPDFSTNIANKVHYMCLKKYISIFDEVRFTIAVDDLSNSKLIVDGMHWIMSLGHTGKKSIRVVENTDLFEVDTFKHEFLDQYEHLDGYVFFGHNKGTTNMARDSVTMTSVFRWICGMYFYNLEFMDEVEGLFSGRMRAPEVFYGTFLTYFSKERQNIIHAMPNNLSGLEYSGTFYWINMPKYKNSRTMGIIKDVEPDSRFFAEEYPGMFFERYAYGCGMTSHNDAAFDAIEYYWYRLDEERWSQVYDTLGNREEFIKFLTEMATVI